MSNKVIIAALDEIKLVCEKHGVFLVGTCESEGIYGEITIGLTDDGAADGFGWFNPDKLSDELSANCAHIERIGSVTSKGG